MLKIIHNFIFVVISTAALCACGSHEQKIDISDPLQVANSVEIIYDEFKKNTTFEGPNIPQEDTRDMVYFRAWKFDDTKEAKYQIVVYDRYDIAHRGGNWRLYHSVHDSDGTNLSL